MRFLCKKELNKLIISCIQTLYEKGARKFGFLSLSPLGCLPALRALNPEANKGGCLEAASALALAHNHALSNVLTSLEHILKGFKYSNSNFYDWLQDRINNPTNYGMYCNPLISLTVYIINYYVITDQILVSIEGFKDGINACCGSGPYGGVFTCGDTKKVRDYELCDNASDYVWWDSFHPTEKIHEQFAKALWNGPPSSVGPYNLESLFSNNKINDLTIADVVDDPEIEQGQFHY